MQIQGRQEFGVATRKLGLSIKRKELAEAECALCLPRGTIRTLERPQEGMQASERSCHRWSREGREIEYHRKEMKSVLLQHCFSQGRLSLT